MNQHFEHLDETVRAIRADCEAQLKAMADKLLAAEIECTLCKDQLNRAILAKEDAIQVTTRLLTQFDVAERVFADAKKFALTFAPEAAADHPLLPKVEMPNGE